jgi:ATP-dependent Clp protease ATP-binding subunit ClpA
VVSLDRKAIAHVVKESFSEEYGARPIRRYLQDKVENLLANYILEEDMLSAEGRRDVVLKLGVVKGDINILNK